MARLLRGRVVRKVAIELLVRVDHARLVALFGGADQSRLGDLRVGALGDSFARVSHVVGVGPVRVDEVFVFADGLGELLLFVVGVGNPKLRQPRVLRVAVLALHLAEERLRLDPVVRRVLFHRGVVGALRVFGVAEGGLGAFALAPAKKDGGQGGGHGKRKRDGESGGGGGERSAHGPVETTRRAAMTPDPLRPASERRAGEGAARLRGRACRPLASGGEPARRSLRGPLSGDRRAPRPRPTPSMPAGSERWP